MSSESCARASGDVNLISTSLPSNSIGVIKPLRIRIDTTRLRIGINTSVCSRPNALPILLANSLDSIAISVAVLTGPLGSRKSLNMAILIAFCSSEISNWANARLDDVSKRCIDGLLVLLEPTGITIPGAITILYGLVTPSSVAVYIPAR